MSVPVSTEEGKGRAVALVPDAASNMFVTMTVAGQLFGISVYQVRDVLGQQRITHVPLAPPEVSGSLNLRGRIVTAVDVRTRLGLPLRGAQDSTMNVVVDCHGELYSLIIDKIGEVLSLSQADFEKNPATLDPRWQEVANGVFRLKDGLLIVLDVERLMYLQNKKAA